MADYYLTVERFGSLRRELAGGLAIITERRLLTDGYGNRFNEVTISRGQETVATGRIHRGRGRVELTTHDPRLIARLYEEGIPTIDELLEHWQKTAHRFRGMPAQTRRDSIGRGVPGGAARPGGLGGPTGGRFVRPLVPGRGTIYELTPAQYQLLQERVGQGFALKREGEYPRMNFRHETLRVLGRDGMQHVVARAYVHYSGFGGQSTSVSLRTSDARIMRELAQMGLRPLEMQGAAD